MAEGVPPRVRLLFLCDGAQLDPSDQKWILKHPWSVVRLPPGASFPFRVEELWAYVQLTDGVGRFDLMLEMRQLMDDGTRRTVGSSKSTTLEFSAGNQLLAADDVFHWKKVPFREAGLYEFCVTTEGQELQGTTFELRVLG